MIDARIKHTPAFFIVCYYLEVKIDQLNGWLLVIFPYYKKRCERQYYLKPSISSVSHSNWERFIILVNTRHVALSPYSLYLYRHISVTLAP